MFRSRDIHTWSPLTHSCEKGLTCPPQRILSYLLVSAQQRVFNTTLQHYRGRVEHVIREVVDGRKALCTTWRGSFPLLAAIMKIVVHIVGLQERMHEGAALLYDVFGP